MATNKFFKTDPISSFTSTSNC